MVCNGFKGGIGTASRKIDVGDESYTVGVLVQCNYNWDGKNLTIGNKPVSQLLPVGKHCFTNSAIERHVDWIPTVTNRVRVRVRSRHVLVTVRSSSWWLLTHRYFLISLGGSPSDRLSR